jgi:hypothetical protein
VGSWLSLPFRAHFFDAAIMRRTFVGSPASEQSANHAADQANGSAAAAVMVSTAAPTTGRTVIIGFVAGARKRP